MVKWLEHEFRVGTNTMIYLMLEWDAGNKRRRSRPPSKWLQKVKEDMKKAGITNWKPKAKENIERNHQLYINEESGLIHSSKWI